MWLDLEWIVNPFCKVDLDLDCQSYISDGFGLDWQSKKFGLSNTLSILQKWTNFVYSYSLLRCHLNNTWHSREGAGTWIFFENLILHFLEVKSPVPKQNSALHLPFLSFYYFKPKSLKRCNFRIIIMSHIKWGGGRGVRKV